MDTQTNDDVLKSDFFSRLSKMIPHKQRDTGKFYPIPRNFRMNVIFLFIILTLRLPNLRIAIPVGDNHVQYAHKSWIIRQIGFFSRSYYDPLLILNASWFLYFCSLNDTIDERRIGYSS